MAVGLSAAVAALTFTSCSGNTTKTYQVATNAQFAPFEYMDGSTMVGFEVDLMSDISSQAGIKTKMVDMEFDAVISSVQTGAYDMACSGLTINDERKQSVDFSIPYYVSHQEVIVKTGDPMLSMTTADEVNTALEGKTIGVCAGYTGSDYVQGDADNNWPGISGATLKTYDNISLAITDLKAGNIDCVVMDNVPALQACNADANKGAVEVVNVPLTDEQYGIAFKKGNTALETKVNNAITALQNNGTIDQLVQKWIAGVAGDSSSADNSSADSSAASANS